MAGAVATFTPGVERKPPRAEQYNWITGQYERDPDQLRLGLEFPLEEEIRLPAEDAVTLLATESGSQLVVGGPGLSLGKKSERVTIRKNRKICGELPLYRVQEIVVLGGGISISTDLIEEACRRGIRIAVLSGGGRPVALLTSPMLTATVETRRAQMAAYGDHRGAEFARWVVAGKLHNQEKLLLYFSKSREGEGKDALEEGARQLRRLRKQALAVEAEDMDGARGSLMGLEGAGGRTYWEKVKGLLPGEMAFPGRIHEHPKDGVNAALNYGYGILYAHVWGAVMNAGLEPFAGFLHSDRAGKPSLVLDMTEEFRQPVVDRPLFAWLNKGGRLKLEGALLDGASREAVATRVLLRMNAVEEHRGKSHQVRSIIQMQARLAAAAFRERSRYRPYAFKW
jgi:CRISPR-associated protein Cas1